MVQHRGHNEGSVYKKRDKWVVSISYKDANGNAKRSTKTYATKKEANEARIAMLAQRQQGIDLTPNKQTLADFMAEMLVKHFTGDQSTRECYQRTMRLHVYPYPIGRTELGKLTPKMLSDHYYRLRTEARVRKPHERQPEPLSNRSVELVHDILHKQLKQAVRWGVLLKNPAADATVPRPDKYEAMPLSLEQRTALLNAARGDDLEALYVVALGTGMRISEILGLRWSDVNWSDGQGIGTLTVRKQAKRTKEKGLHLDDTKTDKPRVIPVIGQVMVALQAHRDRQVFHKASGVAWANLDLVFPNGEGKLMEAQNHHRRSWKPLLERAGLPAETTFHTLRHTYATHCVQQGIDINTVQTWLGHSTSKMLLEVYAHYGPAHGASQTNLLNGLLGAVAS